MFAKQLNLCDIQSVIDKGSLNLHVQGHIAKEILMSLKFYKKIYWNGEPENMQARPQ